MYKSIISKVDITYALLIAFLLNLRATFNSIVHKLGHHLNTRLVFLFSFTITSNNNITSTNNNIMFFSSWSLNLPISNVFFFFYCFVYFGETVVEYPLARRVFIAILRDSIIMRGQ